MLQDQEKSLAFGADAATFSGERRATIASPGIHVSPLREAHVEIGTNTRVLSLTWEQFLSSCKTLQHQPLAVDHSARGSRKTVARCENLMVIALSSRDSIDMSNAHCGDYSKQHVWTDLGCKGLKLCSRPLWPKQPKKVHVSCSRHSHSSAVYHHARPTPCVAGRREFALKRVAAEPQCFAKDIVSSRQQSDKSSRSRVVIIVLRGDGDGCSSA